MAGDQGHPTATEMDYPAHERNYSGFSKLIKYSAFASFVIAMVVIYVISN
jgi:hypothetical protein